MESYLYTAVNREGRKVRGEKRAEDVVHLYALLNNEGLYCLNAHRKAQWETQTGKPKNQELSLMCKQLAAMLSSGIPLVNALEMLRQKSDKKKMKKLYAQLVEEVRKGSSLTLAMRQCQQAFPPLLIYLVQAGEMNGTLDAVMERMAGHYDKEYKLRNKVTSALIYPVMLLVVTVAVILALMTSVVPSF
ncbi:MAG: type II secretion system F family protein [Holdemania massiliensis]